jgi:hypothetical protein
VSLSCLFYIYYTPPVYSTYITHTGGWGWVWEGWVWENKPRAWMWIRVVRVAGWEGGREGGREGEEGGMEGGSEGGSEMRKACVRIECRSIDRLVGRKIHK